MSKVRRGRTLVVGFIAVLIVGALGSWVFWYVSQPIVPDAIRKQLPFSPLVYVGDSYKASDYRYAAGEKVLSYVLKGDGNSITLAEQSLPAQFIDIPEYKDRFLDAVTKRYATVQASDLTVYLTRPPKQEKQVGVIVDKGLLIFMTADRDLDEAQWRKLVDNMTIEKAQ